MTDTWPAPAKLNRMLRILGRRPDGYHRLQTVFQFIDRCDRLDFTLRDDGRITRRTELPGVAPEQDLCLRAARVLQQAGDVTQGVTIGLDKRLPMGGGLGGGSSDAATTLVALNHYWRLGLSLDRLAGLGLSLGADVPVFVQGRAAWAEGVGERLTVLEPDCPWFVVLVPDCQVSTAAVFNDPGLTRDALPIKIADFIGGDGGNDCESVVYRRYPEVAAAAHWLSRHGTARLTGTGGCVFAAFQRREAAQAVLDALPQRFSGFLARGLNTSPLLDRLGRATTRNGGP